MGQGIGRLPEAPAVGGDADRGHEPIGRYIAQQRRLRGIELEELAARTRIPRRSLERLEAGAFDHSPDGFSRGFVRTVAEAIGLDPDDAVARMLPEPDAARRGPPPGGRMFAAIAAAVALLGLAIAAHQLASSLPARPARANASGLPVRRDYVRALAETQGIATAKLTARHAVLEPLARLPDAAAGATGELAAAGEAAGPAARATLPATAPSPAATASPSPAAAPSATPASALGIAAPAGPARAPEAAAGVRPQPPRASGAETPTPSPVDEGAVLAEPAMNDGAQPEAPSAGTVREAPAATTIDAEARD